MAGTTNFLQFNPTAANQETDDQYSADSARTGGSGLGSVFASALGNKLFYQLSTFVAAFCGMLAAKGYTTSDTDINQLETVLASVLTSADQKPDMKVIAYGNAPIFDASTANGFEIVLSGNVTGAQIKNVSPGQLVLVNIVQDATGGRTFAWQTTPAGAGTIDGTAKAVNAQVFFGRSDGSPHALTAISVS